MADESDSDSTFADVFDRMAGRAFNFGGDYLTLKGQEAIAKAQLDAQVRLNGYSQVNPSLGAVAPGAATRVAAQTPAQSWLPWGQPITGTTGNTATAGPAGATNPLKFLVWAAVAVLGVILVVRLVKK